MIDRAQVKDWANVWWLSVVLLPAAIYFVVTRGNYTWLDNVDLAIHELGHVLFASMGEPLRMAGGTLLQILLPGSAGLYALYKEYRVACQLFLFWLGHNLINISVYAADARAQMLPLVGPPGARHDWHWMLGELGILSMDHAIGIAFWVLGGVAFFASLIAPRQLF